MRYYAKYNDENRLISIGTGSDGIEITAEEYSTFLIEIRRKASLVDELYNKQIVIDDVPVQWQEEIQRRVDERIAAADITEQQEISSEEFYSMVEEVL